MMLPKFSLKNPHTILALVLMVTALGFFSFWLTPTDLFPDTTPPQVSVVTVYPGATSKDVADKITWVLEKEINTLPGLTRITSTSRDEVSSIRVEFNYEKVVGEAVLNVQNTVARVRGDLPAGAQDPRIYRITDATRPLLTLSLTPKIGSMKTLAEIRLLAENDIKNELLAVPGVGDVQVFGGHQPEVVVRVDRDALVAHGLTLDEVIVRLATQNVSAPAGTIYGSKEEFLIQVAGEFLNARALESLPLASTASSQIYLRDVATVSLSEADLRSLYHGNGKPAIALNVLRPDGGPTIKAIHNVKAYLPELQRKHSDIAFDVTEDQQPIIDINIRGMRASLCQAIGLTVLVIFFFLASARAAVAVSISIPLSFLAGLSVIWFSPFTLDMVTLSALIVSVGMVVDASIVVIENISRHYSAMETPDPFRAALKGTSEVAQPITAGMLTTVVVLMPLMFTRGFTGRIMLPLNMTIISTLIASLLVSLTVIPIVAAKLLRREHKRKNFFERLFAPVGRGTNVLTEVYVSLVRWSLRHRVIFMILALVFFIGTMRFVRPLIGGEEMPPMDTGIVLIEFDTASGDRPREVERILGQVEQIINRTPGVLTVSSVVGSEPGVVSFGAGTATTQSIKMTIRLVDRTRRDQSIWQINQVWRDEIRTISGVRTYRVSEYGATAVSTTKAPFDVIISGPDPKVLDRLADRILNLLKGTPGLMDLRRSWYADKPQKTVTVDPHLSSLYGTSPAEVGQNLKAAVQGLPATTLRLAGFLDIPVRVRYRAEQAAEPERLTEAIIPTRLGPVPLRSLATLESRREPPFITRENMKNTIDLTGGNQVLTISQVSELAKKQIQKLDLPSGYDITVVGSAADLAAGQKEMGQALLIGLVLLYILLLAIFNSSFHPISIMTAIPLAVSGAFWGLLIFDKPFCKPAFMGVILLGGTIVNNSILMLDFIIKERRKGVSLEEAITQSVRLRLRPILMTATSTVVGFAPLTFEMAVGLERMSPLGVVAGTGLIVGTIVTTVATPVIYSLLESFREKVVSRVPGKKGAGVPIALILAALIAAATPKASWAQETLPAPLSLKAAVRYALKHNPDLHTHRAEVARLEGAKTAVQAARRIQMDLLAAGTFSQEKHGLIPQADNNVQRFDDNLYQVGVRARYLLFDFGRSNAQVKNAVAKLKAGMNRLSRLQQEVVFEVSQLFLSALSVQDLLEAARASQKSLAALVENTDSLYVSGRAARIDSLKVRVRLARVESEIAVLKSRQRTLKVSLAASLGWENDLPVLPYRNPDVAQADSVGQAEIAEVILSRPDVAAMKARKEATGAEILAARKAYLPKVEAFGSYAWYGAADPKSAIPNGPTDRWEDDAVVGVQFTWPLLDGGLRRGQLAQAVAQDKAAQAYLQHLRLAAKQEIISAEARLDSALAQVTVNALALTHAEETLRVEKLKYSAGKGIINDVLDAEAARFDADSLERQSRRKAEIALLSLDLALGRIKTE
jgi:multidrug efflux pump subunit AcrB/outer membrane protein TolC